MIANTRNSINATNTNSENVATKIIPACLSFFFSFFNSPNTISPIVATSPTSAINIFIIDPIIISFDFHGFSKTVYKNILPKFLHREKIVCGVIMSTFSFFLPTETL
jgi:hypothetical protein